MCSSSLRPALLLERLGGPLALLRALEHALDVRLRLLLSLLQLDRARLDLLDAVFEF